MLLYCFDGQCLKVFSTLTVVLYAEKGVYPENSHVVFCEPFTCLYLRWRLFSEGIRTHSTNCLAGKEGKSQVHEGTELNNSACFVNEWFICVLISKLPLFSTVSGFYAHSAEGDVTAPSEPM